MSVKERLKAFIAYLDISTREFETLIGVSHGYVANISKSIQPDKLERISHQYPELDTGWLITGIGEMLKSSTTNRRIPLYDTSTIGGSNDLAAPTGESSHISEWIDAGDWFPQATAAIHHYGDSMIEYPNGCILVLKDVRDRALLINGQAYVIETDEYRVTKKISDNGDYLRAYSTNTETWPDGTLIHKPFNIPKNSIRRIFLIIGCVLKEFSNRPIPIK